MYKRGAEKTGVLEVIRMSCLNLACKIQLGGCRLCNLILRFVVSCVIVRPFDHGMIWAVGEEFHCLHSLVPIFWCPLALPAVLRESGSYESLADVGNTFVTEIVCELEPIILAFVPTLSSKKLQALRIPGTTGISQLRPRICESQEKPTVRMLACECTCRAASHAPLRRPI